MGAALDRGRGKHARPGKGSLGKRAVLALQRQVCRQGVGVHSLDSGVWHREPSCQAPSGECTSICERGQPAAGRERVRAERSLLGGCPPFSSTASSSPPSWRAAGWGSHWVPSDLESARAASTQAASRWLPQHLPVCAPLATCPFPSCGSHVHTYPHHAAPYQFCAREPCWAGGLWAPGVVLRGSSQGVARRLPGPTSFLFSNTLSGPPSSPPWGAQLLLLLPHGEQGQIRRLVAKRPESPLKNEDPKFVSPGEQVLGATQATTASGGSAQITGPSDWPELPGSPSPTSIGVRCGLKSTLLLLCS